MLRKDSNILRARVPMPFRKSVIHLPPWSAMHLMLGLCHLRYCADIFLAELIIFIEKKSELYQQNIRNLPTIFVGST